MLIPCYQMTAARIARELWWMNHFPLSSSSIRTVLHAHNHLGDEKQAYHSIEMMMFIITIINV
jgi:hypothetical protein